MTDRPSEKTFFKALGPGLLWAGAAIGVSHLVQSTRAGASFGFGLLLVILVANVFKYPAFSFGPRYAAATGTSLLEGYRRRGTWALVLYAVLMASTMFTIQAIVTMVTGALGAAVIGWREPWMGLSPVFWISLILTTICAGLLLIGQYRWLDKIVKVVVVVLTLSTVSATVMLLPRIPWGEMPFLPTRDAISSIAAALWLAALIGWMPSAFDISIWHSLWTLARRRETKHAPTVKESLIDFNVGYLGTAFLSLCFLTLGAGVIFATHRSFSESPVVFASQIVDLYAESLGEWSRVLIGLSALTVMFSTTLTVVDGAPRAIACLVARFRGPEVPDHPTDIRRSVYWIAIVLLGAGSLAIIHYGTSAYRGAFKAIVDLATTMSFLTAPALAWLNHRAMLGDEVPPEHRPDRRMIAFSRAGIGFCAIFAIAFLVLKGIALFS